MKHAAVKSSTKTEAGKSVKNVSLKELKGKKQIKPSIKNAGKIAAAKNILPAVKKREIDSKKADVFKIKKTAKAESAKSSTAKKSSVNTKTATPKKTAKINVGKAAVKNSKARNISADTKPKKSQKQKIAAKKQVAKTLAGKTTAAAKAKKAAPPKKIARKTNLEKSVNVIKNKRLAIESGGKKSKIDNQKLKNNSLKLSKKTNKKNTVAERDKSRSATVAAPAAAKKSLTKNTKLPKIQPRPKSKKATTAAGQNKKLKAVKTSISQSRKSDSKIKIKASDLAVRKTPITSHKNNQKSKNKDVVNSNKKPKSRIAKTEITAMLTKKRLFLKTLTEKSAASAELSRQKKIAQKATQAAVKNFVRHNEKTVEKINSEKIVRSANSKKKSFTPIGAAILRGKNQSYEFEVFPIESSFSTQPAIYVISRRILDGRRRGHHKFICIGETESLSEAVKTHRREHCIKKHDANVICVLREDNELKRQKIESDLKAAHTINCVQQ